MIISEDYLKCKYLKQFIFFDNWIKVEIENAVDFILYMILNDIIVSLEKYLYTLCLHIRPPIEL